MYVSKNPAEQISLKLNYIIIMLENKIDKIKFVEFEVSYKGER